MVSTLDNLADQQQEFAEFCDYLQKASGITISPEKAYLVKTRIRKVMIEYKLESLRDLLKELKGYNRKLKQDVVDVMTTNETFWFRDNYPFDYFSKTLLETWNKESRFEHKPIRIWCAACSSGQEPYSLAMLIEEFQQRNRFSKKVEIVATDLSSHILEKAKLGEYDSLSIGRGLSPERLNKFFNSQSNERWAIKHEVRRHISFRPINLLESFVNLGKFDIIFCRNVLIYFTKETKTDILTRMHQNLNPNGYLCLGSSEGLGNAGALFDMVSCNPGLMYQAK